MSDKKPFIVGHWDDLFLANKIRSLERKKKTNLYLATMGCLCFALFGAITARPASDAGAAALQGQTALWIAITFAMVLVVATFVAAFLSRTPQKVAVLESSLIKGFSAALDSSDLNPQKRDPKKGEVRS
jgi:hypothetical protein